MFAGALYGTYEAFRFKVGSQLRPEFCDHSCNRSLTPPSSVYDSLSPECRCLDFTRSGTLGRQPSAVRR